MKRISKSQDSAKSEIHGLLAFYILRLLNDAPQDSVGMPAVVYGNMNTILRGRVESSEYVFFLFIIQQFVS